MNAVGSGGSTILIVDDDQDIRFVLTEALQFDGYTALSAGSAEEAIETIERNPQVRLVISDVRMAKTSGVELARRLHVMSPGVSVVLMTGLGSTLDEHVPPGVTLLQKPIDLDVLQSMVRDLLA